MSILYLSYIKLLYKHLYKAILSTCFLAPDTTLSRLTLTLFIRRNVIWQTNVNTLHGNYKI